MTRRAIGSVLVLLLAAVPVRAEMVGGRGLGLAVWSTEPAVDFGSPIELTAELRNESTASLNVVAGNLPAVGSGPAYFKVDIVDSLGRSVPLGSTRTLSYRALTRDDVKTLAPGEKLQMTFALRDDEEPEHRQRLASGEPEPDERAKAFYVAFGSGPKPAFWQITVRYVCNETGASLGMPIWQGTLTSNTVEVGVLDASPPPVEKALSIQRQYDFGHREKY